MAARAPIDGLRLRLTDRPADDVPPGRPIHRLRQRLADGPADDVPPRRPIHRLRQRLADRPGHNMTLGAPIHPRRLPACEVRGVRVHQISQLSIYRRSILDAR
jgi:hypothetical protein